MMKRFISCALLGLIVSSLVGCAGSRSGSSNEQSGQNQAIQRVDPLAANGQLATAGQVALTRNFYLVFDGSGSMAGDKLRRAKAATLEFLSGLPDDVNIGLYVFDGGGRREVVALGANTKAQVSQAVTSIRAEGGTPLGVAIREGTKSLVAQYQTQLGYGDYRLIVITDGEPDAYYDMADAVKEAAKYGMPICTIGIAIGPDHALRQFSLSYKDTDNAAELTAALKEAAAELDTFDQDQFKK